MRFLIRGSGPLKEHAQKLRDHNTLRKPPSVASGRCSAEGPLQANSPRTSCLLKCIPGNRLCDLRLAAMPCLQDPMPPAASRESLRPLCRSCAWMRTLCDRPCLTYATSLPRCGICRCNTLSQRVEVSFSWRGLLSAFVFCRLWAACLRLCLQAPHLQGSGISGRIRFRASAEAFQAL